MKVYQVKVCVRGNVAAHQICLVEAEDYKIAVIKSLEKFAQANNFPIDQCAVIDVRVIEEIAPVIAAESIDILRVDECHRKNEILGE